MSFAGKNALVTVVPGALDGVIALKLAEMGRGRGSYYRNRDAALARWKKSRTRVEKDFCSADVCQPIRLADLPAGPSEFGSLDIFVSNARTGRRPLRSPNGDHAG